MTRPSTLAFLVAALAIGPAAGAATFTVTQGGDSGAGSLRAAITAANADASGTVSDPHVIVFQGVSQVTLTSPLPILSRPALVNVFGGEVVIRATSLVTGSALSLGAGSAGSYLQSLAVVCTSPLPCFSGSGIAVFTGSTTTESTLDLVRIDGVGAAGVDILGSRVRIDRSEVVRAGQNASGRRSGIYCGSSGRLTLTRSRIGIRANGSAAGNGSSGVHVNICPSSRIGGDGLGNVISSNAEQGLWFVASESAVVEGNLIGLDPNGQQARGNGGSGILVSESTVTIGGTQAALGNTIAGNGGSNLSFGSADPNRPVTATIRRNRIGSRADGSPLPAGANPAVHGILATGLVRLTVGGDGHGNLIRDHVGAGVALNQSGAHQSYATLSQNSIHANQSAVFEQAGLPVPVLNPLGGTSLITGHVPGGLGGGVVEFYVDDWAQARQYVGRTDSLSGNGVGGVDFSALINLSAHSGKRLTALYRHPPTGAGAASNRTGAFSVPVPIGPNILSVTLVGAASGERVESGPLNILCPGFCTAGFASGTVALVAFSLPNRQVTWSGDCSGSEVCNVQMNTNRNVTATFGPAQRLLTVNRNGNGRVTSIPLGIDCGSDCQKNFNHGVSVLLSASPAVDHRFVGWGGACSGTASECTLSMTQARTVEATFVRIPRTVTVQRTGSGTVTSTPAGIDCGSTCSASFGQGTTMHLDATPAPGWQFAAWGNCQNPVGTRCSITVPGADLIVGAVFTPQPAGTHALTVQRTGSGTVTSSPAGISCGSTCSAAFAEGTVVGLTATPAAGWSFAGWAGACSGTGACSVTMTQARNVSATFAPPTHSLTVNRTGSGTVTSSPVGISCGNTCTASFDEGTVVELNAVAAAGWRFDGYTGACAGMSCTVTMTQARSVGAVFSQLPPTTHTLTVNRSGSGTVSSSPAGISCGSACSAAFTEGTVVTLTATPASGWQFVGWGGACNGQGGCSVTMDQARSVSATFTQIPPNFHTLTVQRSGEGTVTSSPSGILCGETCSASYVQDSVVTLTAEAAAGWSFAGWTGACSGTGGCSVTMSQARSVGAGFTSGQQQIYRNGFEGP